MSLLIGFLTFILVLNCLFLILLVLIQLPKKEAGAGLAFGGGATDALFGAGSGNALTKMTKYAATSFMGLALVLSLLGNYRAKESNRRLEEELLKKANAPAATAAPAPAPTAPVPAAAPAPVLVPETTITPVPAPAPTLSLEAPTTQPQAVAPAPGSPAPANPAPAKPDSTATPPAAATPAPVPPSPQ